eukprot:TRINITY_DN8121_c0_g1_i1.p2 TRINITY_DN8121_c0_g1~~TRINITY_DN8121_c0_g1_i1.p2  ORF type:complete len:109 (-),score=13.44 TRINITY_DN8121_c0_g1_i1:544-870(-)
MEKTAYRKESRGKREKEEEEENECREEKKRLLVNDIAVNNAMSKRKSVFFHISRMRLVLPKLKAPKEVKRQTAEGKKEHHVPKRKPDPLFRCRRSLNKTICLSEKKAQ